MPAYHTSQKQTDGRFVNPPKQPNQRKRIAVICAAVVIIVAAVIAIVLPMMPKAQAQIELSYPPENAYMMKEDDGFVGWMIHFYSTNVSDVPFTPTYAQAKWYVGDKLNGSSPAIDYEFMRNWMESDALVKGEMPLDLYCGTDKLNVDRGVPEVFNSCYDVRCLLDATSKMMDGKKLADVDLPFGGKLVEKAALKKIHGTVIEELLERYHLI